MICRKSLLMKSIIASAFAGAVIFSFMFTQPVAAHDSEEGDGGHIIPHEIGKLNISGGITSILQGTSGIAGSRDVTDFTYTLDLNFEAGVTPTGKVVVALELNDVEASKALLVAAESKIARAKGKGLLHPNTAARKISRLAKKVAAATRTA